MADITTLVAALLEEARGYPTGPADLTKLLERAADALVAADADRGRQAAEIQLISAYLEVASDERDRLSEQWHEARAEIERLRRQHQGQSDHIVALRTELDRLQVEIKRARLSEALAMKLGNRAAESERRLRAESAATGTVIDTARKLLVDAEAEIADARIGERYAADADNPPGLAAESARRYAWSIVRQRLSELPGAGDDRG